MQKRILKTNLTKNEYASVLQLTDMTMYNLLLKQGQHFKNILSYNIKLLNGNFCSDKNIKNIGKLASLAQF